MNSLTHSHVSWNLLKLQLFCKYGRGKNIFLKGEGRQLGQEGCRTATVMPCGKNRPREQCMLVNGDVIDPEATESHQDPRCAPQGTSERWTQEREKGSSVKCSLDVSGDIPALQSPKASTAQVPYVKRHSICK